MYWSTYVMRSQPLPAAFAIHWQDSRVNSRCMTLETQRMNQMIMTWGDDLLETAQGLDILGARGIDQAVELTLINGITTIFQRARCFTILPWALSDNPIDHTSEGFEWDSLTCQKTSARNPPQSHVFETPVRCSLSRKYPMNRGERMVSMLIEN